jgi:4-hydroxybenzoate polyprenyltransferase
MSLGFLRLLRVEQWYKNLVVFFALFFTNNLFNPALLPLSVMGFFSLCLLSSSYYVLNDIRDAAADRRHPEKKGRPIASGEVSVASGYALSLVLFVLALAAAYPLHPEFAAYGLLLFSSGLAYNLGLKDVAFVDIHVIAVNFLIRAVAGAAAIQVPASPWLVTTVFFSALLLGVGKRRAELALLGADAVRFKEVYKVYTQQLLDMLLVIVSSILLFSYILYTFFVHSGGAMMVTIPFASFVVFRFLHFTLTNQRSARKAHYLLVDPQVLGCLVLWGLTLYYLMYVKNL